MNPFWSDTGQFGANAYFCIRFSCSTEYDGFNTFYYRCGLVLAFPPPFSIDCSCKCSPRHREKSYLPYFFTVYLQCFFARIGNMPTTLYISQSFFLYNTYYSKAEDTRIDIFLPLGLTAHFTAHNSHLSCMTISLSIALQPRASVRASTSISSLFDCFYMSFFTHTIAHSHIVASDLSEPIIDREQ